MAAAASAHAALTSPPSPRLKGSIATCRTCGVSGHRTALCIAHLLPHVILHSPASKKHRLEQCMLRWRQQADDAGEEEKSASDSGAHHPGAGLAVVPSLRESELLFLRSPTPGLLLRDLQHSPLLARHLYAVFLVAGDEKELSDVAARVDRFVSAALADQAAEPVFRIQTYPKPLRAELIAALPARVKLHPHSYSHVLMVVRSYGKHFVGFCPREEFVVPHSAEGVAKEGGGDSVPPAGANSASVAVASAVPLAAPSDSEVLSRAFHKLAESFLVFPSLSARIGRGSAAIDVGASPGGWSAFLASRGARVLAIDPGVVLATSPLVRHVSKRVEDSSEDIREFTAEKPLDLIVCDMNVRPALAAELVGSAVAAAHMAPDARLVLTVKETLAGRSKMLLLEAQEGLEEWFGQWEQAHLLSNGKERTLIGKFLNLSPEEREGVRLQRTKNQASKLQQWEESLAQKKAVEALRAEEARVQGEAAPAGRGRANKKGRRKDAAAQLKRTTNGAAASSSAAPAPQADRPGGVGAGLATESWWDQYYRQQHDTFWDWYLPNEVVLSHIMREAESLLGGARESDEAKEDADASAEAEEEAKPAAAAAAAVAASSSSAAVPAPSRSSSLATLPTLQLGCGNSEVTALLWDAGFRSMHNMDFSSEVISRMQALQAEKGWIAPDAAFTFDVMDVRAMSYPSASFRLAFGKGCLDCVVLESADSHKSACAMLREVWRCLQVGGVYLCFSLYPPAKRARYWISVLSEADGGESDAEKAELCEVMEADNPPSHLRTAAWDLRMHALEHSPLELPNQPHTYLYVAVKR